MVTYRNQVGECTRVFPTLEEAQKWVANSYAYNMLPVKYEYVF